MQAGAKKLGVIEASYASAIIGVLSPVSSHCFEWPESIDSELNRRGPKLVSNPPVRNGQQLRERKLETRQ